MRYWLIVSLLLMAAGSAHAQTRIVPSSRGLSMVIPFCGQGGASATDRYIGPATALGEELVPGNATCDAKDGATAAAADALPLGVDSAYTVEGMICQLNSGTDDTVDMTLYDDTVATGVTCTITAAGGIETCRTDAQHGVAEGSLMAILVDNDDDDLSLQDLMCHVFVKY